MSGCIQTSLFDGVQVGLWPDRGGDSHQLDQSTPKSYPWHARLNREVDLLGRLLGTVIKEQAGADILALEEDIRKRVIKLSQHPNHSDEEDVQKIIAGLSREQFDHVNKAFCIYFSLVNLAEQRETIRQLSLESTHGKRASFSESIEGVITKLKAFGLDADEVRLLIGTTSVANVLTAHPTEARLPTITAIVDDISRILDAGVMAGEKFNIDARTERSLLREITNLWQTAPARAQRIDIKDEIRAGLGHFRESLWQLIAQVGRGVEESLREQFPKAEFSFCEFASLIRFRTWIGSDADGNPYATPQVLIETLLAQREEALSHYIEEAKKLAREVSLSVRETKISSEMQERVGRSRADNVPDQPYTVFFEQIEGKLQATRNAITLGLPQHFQYSAGSEYYRNADEFVADLALARKSLLANGGERLADGRLSDLICQATNCRFHLASADVRQHSEVHSACLAEMFRQHGIEGYSGLDESEKSELLRKAMISNYQFIYRPLQAPHSETVDRFKAIRMLQEQLGSEVIQKYIVSFSNQPSDLLEVLLFCKESGLVAIENKKVRRSSIDIVPLFETLDDLKDSPSTIKELLADPLFRSQVKARGDILDIMLGYSDSSKDAGYLASNIALRRAQIELSRTAQEFDVRINFFHGRGGTTSRGGGGPLHSAVLAQPIGTLGSEISVTKQGEVISNEFSDPRIARDTTERLVGAVIALNAAPLGALGAEAPAGILEPVLDRLALSSCSKYRELIRAADFAGFFMDTTPARELESLHIGARPNKRSANDSIEAMRAITVNHASNQAGTNLLAWYGVGTALDHAFREYGTNVLLYLYRESRFLRNILQNCEVALCKADMNAFRSHTEQLAGDPEKGKGYYEHIRAEYDLTKKMLLKISNQKELLDRDPELQTRLKLRTPYLRALRELQRDILLKWRSGSEEFGEGDTSFMREQFQKNATGVAQGTRNTG